MHSLVKQAIKRLQTLVRLLPLLNAEGIKTQNGLLYNVFTRSFERSSRNSLTLTCMCAFTLHFDLTGKILSAELNV